MASKSKLLVLLVRGSFLIILFPTKVLAFSLDSPFQKPLSIDFALGAPLMSWQNTLTRGNPVSYPSVDSKESTSLKTRSGFIGLGIFFPQFLSWAIGVEYTFLFISQYSYFEDFANLLPGVESRYILRTDKLFVHLGDIYYKINIVKRWGLDWQFNLGVAVEEYLSIAHSFKEGDINFEEEIELNDFSLGYHVGTKLSLFFLFLSFDYILFPGSSHKNSFALAEIDLNQHRFSLSLGILFNKSTLDLLLK